MEKSNSPTKASAREKLLSRAREHFPDRTFADLGAEPGEGAADLDEAIDEWLADLSTRQKTYDEKNAKLRELLMQDPSSAEFIQRWQETGDPRTALVEMFGDELGLSEEAREKFKGNLDTWKERKAANDALEAEAEANWQASLEALDKWGETKGLSLKDKRDVMLRLMAITFNGVENKYGEEDFALAYNALHYDTDVENARKEGEVEGRNAKITAARRDRVAASNMPPAPTGRMGGVVSTAPKKRSFWGEVNSNK